MTAEQYEKMANSRGFVAALDQSGGSTPKALALYGVPRDSYATEDEMFALVHQMRCRIITSPAFTGDRILAAILFDNTLNREIDGRNSAEYLWAVKRVVPLLKVDSGLAPESIGVQVMKPMPNLASLLDNAVAKGVFGTKMRSVIKLADPAGVARVVDQQFDIANQILATSLIPIIEPEVDIHSPQKAQAEGLLRGEILRRLDRLPADQVVMLKLTLPSTDGFYSDLVEHPNVLRVVALSGGYARDEACRLLARNPGVIASFSRALTEGLSAAQSDAEFNAALDASIAEIFAASVS